MLSRYGCAVWHWYRISYHRIGKWPSLCHYTKEKTVLGDKCNNYEKVILLCVPRKVCGLIYNGRMIKIAYKSVGDEQGGFRKGRRCVDLIFALKIVLVKYL